MFGCSRAPKFLWGLVSTQYPSHQYQKLTDMERKDNNQETETYWVGSVQIVIVNQNFQTSITRPGISQRVLEVAHAHGIVQLIEAKIFYQIQYQLGTDITNS